MATHHLHENLYLIDLDLPLAGFRKFISTWLYTAPGLTLVVDPGPTATMPALTTALEKRGIDRLDYILLTHIHADHAGGTGLLARQYPDARIICQPQGIRHLIDPAKLWAGTQKTLGDIAAAYGRIEAVPADRISYDKRIEQGDFVIEAFETPGHAPHHLCFRLGVVLFAGEVAGVIYPFDDGNLYHRPATPPVFDYEISRRSLIRASALEASLVCIGHYGCPQDRQTLFTSALDQLANWLMIVREAVERETNMPEEEIFADILKRDAGISRFQDLPRDIQIRERYFCANSIRGMREYLMRQ